MDKFRITRNVYSMPTAKPAAAAPAREAAAAPEPVVYSVIVPLHNGADAVERLHGRISRVMRRMRKGYEIVLVNDGSTDRTAEAMERIAWADRRVTVVELRRRFGPAAAFQAGLDASVGAIVVAMDPDGQHDPAEIPLLVRKIDEGYDIACGWRVRRRSSRAANWLLRRASGARLHDFGTAFRAYRREVLEGVRLYGRMDRFVPAICAGMGARIAEVPVKNVRGRSGKNGRGREGTLRTAADLLALRLTTACLSRPLGVFGRWGAGLLGGGLGLLGWGLAGKLMNWSVSLTGGDGLLMLAGFVMLMMSLLFLATGLIGEMLMRIYFEAGRNKTYAIRRTIRRAPSAVDEEDGH